MFDLINIPVETPAFIYDESRILAMAKVMAQARMQSACRMLYSIKALPFRPVLELLAPWVDGFSASSLFEAKLAAPIGHPLHITTPGLRLEEIGEIGTLCEFVAFNSLQQFARLQSFLGGKTSAGLRVNPGLSFLDDTRYDPCRTHSKLGVPLGELAQKLGQDPLLGNSVKGLHFHTLYASQSFGPMAQSLALIEQTLGKMFLSRLDWINLGGGYVFETPGDLARLGSIARDLRQRFGVEVFLSRVRLWLAMRGIWPPR